MHYSIDVLTLVFLLRTSRQTPEQHHRHCTLQQDLRARRYKRHPRDLCSSCKDVWDALMGMAVANTSTHARSFV